MQRPALFPKLLALWLVLPWIAGDALAAASVAECNADAHFQTLHAEHASAPEHARAIWLDAHRIRWPGVAPGGRFRLHLSARSALEVEIGKPVGAADDSLELDIQTAPLESALAGRFAWAGEGPLLALRASDRARLPELLHGQLLITREDSSGRVTDVTRTQIAAALDAHWSEAENAPGLGVTVGTDHTAFGLWAPSAQAVSLCLYENASAPATALHAATREDASGIWRLQLPTARHGQYYTWLVTVSVPGAGLVRNRVTDPYSSGLSADSRRTWIGSLQHASVTPEDWDSDRPPGRVRHATDMVIYELHLRDFSRDDLSVPAHLRGKYLAFTETGSDGMRHLRALAEAGLTDVHLLPVYDLSTVPERGCVSPQVGGPPDGQTQQARIRQVRARDCYNWGYDPFHYSAPEGSYASDAGEGAVRILEFRRMVQALHATGLRVGMDVVYNHTFASGQDPKSVLDRIVPGYYHRLDADGRVTRSTCCENTATEHRMMARLMIDSAVTWARDHHIDSFRFDLMGHQPREVMERLRDAVDAAAGREVQLIGEGWNFGEVANGARFEQAAQGALAGSRIATFSDRARDALRGGGPADNGITQLQRQGYLNGLVYAPNAFAPDADIRELMRNADLVRVGLAGTLADYRLQTFDGGIRRLAEIDYNGLPAGYTSEPGEVVNYVENHDNQTLYDVNAFKLPVQTSSAERARVQVLGMAITLFSQGIAYFHAGMDTLRSKSMDRNSFDSGDWFNRIDWRYRDNFFGTGLPPADDNAASWPWMKPLLANPALRPAPEDIAFARDAFRDLLRIRASSTLFRLRTAQQVSERLTLLNTGPDQLPTVLAGHLTGAGLEGAGFGEILYLVNVDLQPHSLQLPGQIERGWVLHPVHLDAQAADRRPRESARYVAASGRFEIPARTALVWVIETGDGRAVR